MHELSISNERKLSEYDAHTRGLDRTNNNLQHEIAALTVELAQQQKNYDELKVQYTWLENMEQELAIENKRQILRNEGDKIDINDPDQVTAAFKDNEPLFPRHTLRAAFDALESAVKLVRNKLSPQDCNEVESRFDFFLKEYEFFWFRVCLDRGTRKAIEIDHTLSIARYNDLEKENVVLKKTISAHQKTIQQLESKLFEYEKQQRVSLSHLDSLHIKVANLKQELNDKQSEIEELRCALQQAGINRVMINDDTVPAQQIKAILDQYQSQLTMANKDKQRLEKELEAERNKMSPGKEQLQKLQIDIASMTQELQELQQDSDEDQELISALQTADTEQKQIISGQEAKIKYQSDKIDKLFTKKNKWKIQALERSKDVEKLTYELEQAVYKLGPGAHGELGQRYQEIQVLKEENAQLQDEINQQISEFNAKLQKATDARESAALETHELQNQVEQLNSIIFTINKGGKDARKELIQEQLNTIHDTTARNSDTTRITGCRI
jgi:chromosome segregation ATPase